VVVGTETSGGYYSCNAQKYNNVILGESGLQLRLPLFRSFFAGVDNPDIAKNRGMVPQHIVKTSLSDELKQTDTQLEFIKQLITTGGGSVLQEEPEGVMPTSRSENNRSYWYIGVVLLFFIIALIVLVKKRKLAPSNS
jgi:hypothetical protein